MTDAPANNDAGNADDQATQEANEWDNAHEELLSSKGLETSNDDDKSDKGGQDAGNKDDSNKDDNKGSDTATGTGDDGDKGEKGADDGKNDDDTSQDNSQEQEDEYDPTTAQARKTQREIQQDREAYVTDIKEKLYPDLKTELEDSEGNPIRTVSDLMKLENPVTKKAFTEDEATIFLMQAKSKLAENNQQAQDRVAEVADVLITVRDESLAVKHKWGPLLKQLDKEQPGFADGLLAKFKKQLDVDPDSGVIVGFKLSPEEFYDTALAGYEQARKALETGEQRHQQDQDEVKKAQLAAEKAKSKRDRGDITSSNNTDTRDKEDKEWDQAEQEVFGDRLATNNKKK